MTSVTWRASKTIVPVMLLLLDKQYRLVVQELSINYSQIHESALISI